MAHRLFAVLWRAAISGKHAASLKFSSRTVKRGRVFGGKIHE